MEKLDIQNAWHFKFLQYAEMRLDTEKGKDILLFADYPELPKSLQKKPYVIVKPGSDVASIFGRVFKEVMFYTYRNLRVYPRLSDTKCQLCKEHKEGMTKIDPDEFNPNGFWICKGCMPKYLRMVM